MKAAVLFDNFGPYHVARLSACAGLCDLTGIQVFARSEEYPWDPLSKLIDFPISTVFSSGKEHDHPPGKFIAAIEDVLTKLDPKIVFVPGWSSRAAFVTLGWCVRHGVPAVAMSESTEWDENRFLLKEGIKKRILKLYSAALVGGQPHRDYITKLGMPKDRVFLGYDAVDNAYYASKGSEILKDGSRNFEQAMPKGKYFLASARFVTKKNLLFLLKAVARYREINGASSSWPLVLLGDGPLGPEVRAKIAELKLSEMVYLPGFVQHTELPQYYAFAGAFVHASTTEQWGLVVNEAMASGLPVLVSNRCGCAKDLVKEGENGFTFSPTDVEELTQLLVKVSASNFLLEKHGTRSREIIANWGVERFSSGFKGAMDRAVEVGPKPSSFADRLMLKALLLDFKILALPFPDKLHSLTEEHYRGHKTNIAPNHTRPHSFPLKGAVVFDNFGPYHIARLSACASLCDLTGIQVFARSEEYKWDPLSKPIGFPVSTVFTSGTEHDLPPGKFAEAIEHVLTKLGPQVVFVPGWSSRAAFVTLGWCVRHGVPAIAMSASTEQDENRFLLKEGIKKRILKLYSAALVAGQPHRDYIMKLGMPQDRVFLGYDAVDNSYYTSRGMAIRKEGERNFEEPMPDGKYFLASARFVQKKNLMFLLKAVARYREIKGASSSWPLVLLGDGPLGPEVRAKIAELKLSEMVYLPGFVQHTELPKYYAFAGAFVHASTTEQWGLVVNEAMASGLPVLVSNRCGCAKDLVKKGENGFTFSPTDLEELAQLLVKVSASDFPLEKYGTRSREIIANWGVERFSSGFKGAMDRAAEVGPKSSALADRLMLKALIRS